MPSYLRLAFTGFFLAVFLAADFFVVFAMVILLS